MWKTFKAENSICVILHVCYSPYALFSKFVILHICNCCSSFCGNKEKRLYFLNVHHAFYDFVFEVLLLIGFNSKLHNVAKVLLFLVSEQKVLFFNCLCLEKEICFPLQNLLLQIYPFSILFQTHSVPSG